MEERRHGGMMANIHITIGFNSYEKINTFKYSDSLLTDKNSINEKIKFGLQAGNLYYSV